MQFKMWIDACTAKSVLWILNLKSYFWLEWATRPGATMKVPSDNKNIYTDKPKQNQKLKKQGDVYT